MVSEDSLHRVTPLATAVHALTEGQNGDIVGVAEASASQDRYCISESREILRLCPDELEALEERDDSVTDVSEVVHLPVPATIAGPSHASTAQRAPEELQRSPVLLRHVESCRELPLPAVV